MENLDRNKNSKLKSRTSIRDGFFEECERKFDIKTNSYSSKIIKNNGFLQSFYINLGV